MTTPQLIDLYRRSTTRLIRLIALRAPKRIVLREVELARERVDQLRRRGVSWRSLQVLGCDTVYVRGD